ncbi:MAG TPA: DnaJ domain-containing protein [Pyrinomonadaceae bacterium]|jgi:curved DNA-binding protein CbpA|nr:DnaJ domain-containing protein [Pyrinomonadaceae bacterium]
MNGRLTEHPLTELIRELIETRASGALRLNNGRVRAAVYFEQGELAAALTNVRTHRLAEVLRRTGAVPAEQLDAVLTETMSDEQAALAVVRAGLMPEAELRKARERQSIEVLRALLLWAEGDWEFDTRVRLAGGFRARVEARPLLAEGARHLPPDFAASRIADDSDVLTPAGGVDAVAASGVQLLPAEAFILSRVTAPMSLGELVAVGGLPEAETRRAVYTLALAGLLRRGRWPRVANTGAARQAAPRPAAPPEQKTAPEPPPPPPAAPEPPPPAPPEEKERDPRADLEELFERARGATHYEVLGVPRSAKPDELKRVYYALAKRLHPDLFRRDSDEPLRQQTDLAFARIAQAYDVLKDPALRAAYDLKHPAAYAGGGAVRKETTPEPETKPQQGGDAEDKFNEGMKALRTGDHSRARAMLGEAALLAPKQARYRAHYGRALARSRDTRRQAEAELQAAVTLEEKNPAYHLMLAEFYRDVGLRRRAEASCERALSLNPKHPEALALMRELRGGG